MDQRAHFIWIVFHERQRYQVYSLAGCKWAEPGPAATARLETQAKMGVCVPHRGPN